MDYFFVRIVRVVGGSWVLRRICCVFVNGNGVKGAPVAFVKEEFVAFANDDNVPWVYRPGSAH